MIDRFEKFSLAVFSISKYWHKIASEEMKKHGLKGPYAFYLVIMANYNGDVTAANLTELCSKDKADVSRAVNAMEKKGFIKRQGENAYRAKLMLTETGKALAAQITNKAILAVEIAGKGLTEEMRTVFYSALDTITGNLKEISREGLPR